MKRFRLRDRGFTIWELLAVIIIVLVVAVILFPVFARSRTSNGHAYCPSNEKQLGLCIMQYVQDNDECMPDISDVKNPKATWRTMIYLYGKSLMLYQCPDRDDKALGPDGFPRSYAGNSAGITYSGRKVDKGDGAFAGPGSEPVSLADFDHPEALITVCEVSRHSTPDFNVDNLVVFNPGSRVLWAGHKSQDGDGQFGSIYLFADGHVKWLRPLDTKAFWHRDGSVPLSAGGIAILQAAQDRAGK